MYIENKNVFDTTFSVNELIVFGNGHERSLGRISWLKSDSPEYEIFPEQDQKIVRRDNIEADYKHCYLLKIRKEKLIRSILNEHDKH